ncbi:DUF4224 domain-containing protein [Rugamonas sp. FT29W]|uniref:DUF4224 domain-containing protein n=2 Tax=Rugamonas aquatica TaxID=2743357 RepID=A0A6A7N2C8_9BURK|nr:DUF4224 domain-containing protein [Rugamonas aquatica]
MFLDADELREMTDRKTRVAQRRMLNALGIVYRIRADGGLLVLRAHVERELGGAPAASARKKEFVPNWSAANA